MTKEELKEVLEDLLSEDYLDKLIHLLNNTHRIGDLPSGDYLDKMIHVLNEVDAITDLPDEDYLDKMIEADRINFEEWLDEDYLDKMIEAGKVEHFTKEERKKVDGRGEVLRSKEA